MNCSIFPASPDAVESIVLYQRHQAPDDKSPRQRQTAEERKNSTTNPLNPKAYKIRVFLLV
jgi:hypothetical protein